MPTINETLVARRATDMASLRIRELWVERSFEYLSGILAHLLSSELNDLPATALRWERTFTDGIVPEYRVTLTVQKNVFGKFMPLIVKITAIEETVPVVTTLSGVATTTQVHRLTVTQIDTLSRRFPADVLIVGGHVVDTDLAAYVNDVTTDFNLRSNLQPTDSNPSDGILPVWPELDLVALALALVTRAAAVLYAERYPGA